MEMPGINLLDSPRERADAANGGSAQHFAKDDRRRSALLPNHYRQTYRSLHGAL